MAATDPVQRLTYPLSPSYLRHGGWNAERAIAELVANAIDEDPNFSYAWADGVLTIEDDGPGIGEEGLVLGFSEKGDDKIGQFGEGSKLSCLLLAREASIGKVRVDTVGYAFEPTIVRESVVPLAQRRSKKGIEILALDFYTSGRARGTKVTIECSEELADAVKARFLHFEPGYSAPSDPGRALADPAMRGRLYIGGVYVSTNDKLALGYDLPLGGANGTKRFQNRDRTVIDGYQLRHAVATILNSEARPEVLDLLVSAALDGSLDESEQSFIGASSPAVRRALTSLGKARFNGQLVCYARPGHEEAALDLQDRGYLILEAQIKPERHHRLCDALGVREAKIAQARPERPVETDWITEAELSEAELTVLADAVAAIRAVYGNDSLGDVKVYEATRFEGHDHDLAFGGFFEPWGRGLVALQRRNLKGLEWALQVLIHEAGHRIGWKRWKQGEWGDRSRGFERELGNLAAKALMVMIERGALPSAVEEQVSQANHPAVKARLLIRERMNERGLRSAAALARETGLAKSAASLLVNGPSGRWTATTRPANVRELASFLDLPWEVIFLCHLTESLPNTTRRKDGKLYGVRMIEFNEALVSLEARQGASPETLAALRAQASGGNEATPKNESGWHAPYLALLDTVDDQRLPLLVAASAE